MKDPADKKTAELPELEPVKPGRGRPRVHQTPEEKKAAQAEAARQYRARKKAERDARRDLGQPISSKIIDLSVLPPWQRKQ